MGTALAMALASAAYPLILFSSNEEQGRSLHERILQKLPGAPVWSSCCAFEASWEADVIIAAVPYREERKVAEKIKDVATRKIVISLSNMIDEDGLPVATATGRSAGEELQQWLPNSQVVKAFNTLRQEDFEKPENINCYLAGNDTDALEKCSQLVKELGFTPVFAGNITSAAELESRIILKHFQTQS